VEILPNVWQFEAVHPDWEEGDDWDRNVAWWAARRPTGLVLIDPLVSDWNLLDGLVAAAGGCAGIIRTRWWHHRTILEMSVRSWIQARARDAERQPADSLTASVAARRDRPLLRRVAAISVERSGAAASVGALRDPCVDDPRSKAPGLDRRRFGDVEELLDVVDAEWA
jgi:hypothetical protein